MKRFLTTLLILCLVFYLLPVSAFAANSTYNLDELGMSIDIPSDHIVFTRDIKVNDPNLSTYGLNKEMLLPLMQAQSIYLNAWDEDVNYEIIVTMMDSPLADYNLLSDTTLATLVSSFETEYAGAGITFIRSDIYQHRQAKFAKIYISQPNNGETAYGLQYNTVYDGKVINVTMQSYSGKIDSTKEATLLKIVESIRFDTEPQLTPPPAQTNAFTFTDPDSGMTFTVPANWVETPMFEEREFIDVKFTSNLEEGLAIIFASEDMLGDDYMEDVEATFFEKLLVSRSHLDNSMLTKEDVAAMCGESASSVSINHYGGKEYFICETMQTGSAYGLTVTVPMTFVVRFENGFMYMFQFSGTKDSPYYGDFENLISSAKYPVIKDETLSQRRMIGIVFFVVVIVAIATFVLLNRRRKCIKKGDADFQCSTAPIANSKEHPDEALVPISMQEGEQNTEVIKGSSVMFCHKCGCRIEHRSRFCHKCGTTLFTKEEE